MSYETDSSDFMCVIWDNGGEDRKCREQKEIDLEEKMAEYCPHIINTINSLLQKKNLIEFQTQEI